jgi:hypothetical protein
VADLTPADGSSKRSNDSAMLESAGVAGGGGLSRRGSRRASPPARRGSVRANGNSGSCYRKSSGGGLSGPKSGATAVVVEAGSTQPAEQEDRRGLEQDRTEEAGDEPERPRMAGGRRLSLVRGQRIDFPDFGAESGGGGETESRNSGGCGGTESRNSGGVEFSKGGANRSGGGPVANYEGLSSMTVPADREERRGSMARGPEAPEPVPGFSRANSGGSAGPIHPGSSRGNSGGAAGPIHPGSSRGNSGGAAGPIHPGSSRGNSGGAAGPVHPGGGALHHQAASRSAMSSSADGSWKVGEGGRPQGPASDARGGGGLAAGQPEPRGFPDGQLSEPTVRSAQRRKSSYVVAYPLAEMASYQSTEGTSYTGGGGGGGLPIRRNSGDPPRPSGSVDTYSNAAQSDLMAAGRNGNAVGRSDYQDYQQTPLTYQPPAAAIAFRRLNDPPGGGDRQPLVGRPGLHVMNYSGSRRNSNVSVA